MEERFLVKGNTGYLAFEPERDKTFTNEYGNDFVCISIADNDMGVLGAVGLNREALIEMRDTINLILKKTEIF